MKLFTTSNIITILLWCSTKLNIYYSMQISFHLLNSAIYHEFMLFFHLTWKTIRIDLPNNDYIYTNIGLNWHCQTQILYLGLCKVEGDWIKRKRERKLVGMSVCLEIYLFDIVYLSYINFGYTTIQWVKSVIISTYLVLTQLLVLINKQCHLIEKWYQY